MNARTSTYRRGRFLFAALGLTGALLATSDVPALAGSNALGASGGLVGVWGVQVTLRDCATGAPLGAPFNSLVSAHRGGTMTESAGSLSFAAGQRTPGHGTWTRKGSRTYQQKVLALILFDTAPNLPGTPTFDPSLPISPGFFAGSVTIHHTIVLGDADHFTSSGTNAFYKADGTVYRTGCSTAVAQRFE
jgi:hypothetical protein